MSTAESLPHRSKYLLLVIDLLRSYLELHRELVDEVEQEFRAFAPEEQDAGIGGAAT